MKNIYKQPELNKMEYAVEAFAAGSETVTYAYDNETTLNYPG